MSKKFLTADLYPLKFSTDAVKLQFELDKGLLFPPPQSKIKVFGLERGEDFETSIDELYKFAGFPARPLIDAKVTLIHPTEKPETLYQRNAVWFIPGDAHATVMRLRFRITEMDSLTAFFQSFLGKDFTISGGNVTVRKRTQYVAEKDIWEDSSEIIMDFAGSISGIGASITSVFRENGREVWLTADFNNADIEKMFDWLKAQFDIPHYPAIPPDLKPEGLSLHRIEMLLNPKRKKCFFASITFKLSTSFGTKDQNALFFFTFSYPEKVFVASLFPGNIH